MPVTIQSQLTIRTMERFVYQRDVLKSYFRNRVAQLYNQTAIVSLEILLGDLGKLLSINHCEFSKGTFSTYRTGTHCNNPFFIHYTW